jgi:hypothetical protein
MIVILCLESDVGAGIPFTPLLMVLIQSGLCSHHLSPCTCVTLFPHWAYLLTLRTDTAVSCNTLATICQITVSQSQEVISVIVSSVRTSNLALQFLYLALCSRCDVRVGESTTSAHLPLSLHVHGKIRQMLLVFS